MADRGNDGSGPDNPFGRPRPNGGSPTGGRPNGRSGGPNGAHPHGVPNRPIPFPVGGRSGDSHTDPDLELSELGDEPLDLVAVQADDELINALAAGMTVSAPGRSGYDADDKVVAMLAAWKAEVDAEPMPALVDLDTAVAAVESGSAKRLSSRRRHLIPLAGAAALIVFSIAGVSIGAQDAGPGDALFPVTQVLYKDAANSKIAANEVQERIQQVNAKLASGDTRGAQQDLAAMAPLLEQVRPEEGKTYLAAQQDFLVQKVQETPAGTPVDPQSPLRNGTPRPQAPATEGDKDSGQPAVPPDSSTTTPGSSTTLPPSSSTAGGGEGGPSSADPRIAQDPDSGGSTSTAPSSSATPPPKTEGGQDPTTPPTTTTTAPSGGTSSTTSMGSTATESPSESAGSTS